MEELFASIIQLVRAVAPESVGNLNPPAAPRQIAKLLETVASAPQELVALLKLHNGEEPISWISLLPNGMQLMDIESILHIKRQLGWPVNDNYLDLDPAPGGRIGQVVEEDAENLRLRVIADSLERLLEKYAQDIRNGAFHTSPQGQIITDTEWPS